MCTYNAEEACPREPFDYNNRWVCGVDHLGLGGLFKVEIGLIYRRFGVLGTVAWRLLGVALWGDTTW
jgi:hypothetical protein